MFPSSGYFRAYFCPYFANGLCERPHCHFRHAREDPPAISLPPRSSIPSGLSGLSSLMGAGDKPDLLMLVREAVLQVQKEVEEDRAKLKGTVAKNVQQQQLENNAVAILKNGVQHLKAQTNVGPVEYKPTPIAKLKKLQEQNKLYSSSSTSSLEYVPESISSNGKVDSPGYKPSLKIPYVPVSRGKSKKNVEYIPSPTCSATNIPPVQHSDSGDDDNNEELNASFSGDDEEDIKSEVCRNSPEKNEEKNKAPTTAESKFDVVNQILTESKLCDSLIKGASKSGTKTTLASKKEKHVKSKTEVKPKSKLASEKKLKEIKSVVANEKKSQKRKSVSFSLSSSDAEGSSAKISSKNQDKSTSNYKSKEKGNDGKVEKSILKKIDSKSKDRDSQKHSKSKGTNVHKTKKSADKDVSKKNSSSSTKEKKHKSSRDVEKCSKSKIKNKDCKPKKHSKSDKSNGKIVKEERNLAINATSCSQSSNDEKVNRQDHVNIKETARDPIEIPKLNPEDLDFDLDEHDTYEECLQIFNEYTPKINPSSSEKHEEIAEDKSVEQLWIGKKRVAHDMAETVTKRPKVVPHFQPPPGQVMHTRFIELQKMMQEAAQNNTGNPGDTDRRSHTQSSSAFLNTVTMASCGKKRIAHVPNVAAMLNTNHHPSNVISRCPSNVETGSNNAAATAVVHQITKGVKRIAHMPALTTLKRPIVPPDYGSRVPNNIRQRYLNLIIDECLKIYDTEQDAFDRGLAEEKNSYDRSSTRTVYINVVVNTIKRLRSEQEGLIPSPIDEVVTPSTSRPQTVAKSPPTSSKRPSLSHEQILGGKKAAKTSYSIQKHKQSEARLTSAVFFKALQPYVLTLQQLEENGFPLPHPTDRNKAIILKQDNAKKKKRPESLEKICCRCGSSFKVTPKGIYVTKDECFYHWGKSYKFRSNGVWETRYSCCQGGHGAEKCSVAKQHVFDEVDYDNLNGFVKLLPKSPPIDGDFKAYSLDCEMCYTGFGLELTRVTVIGQDLNVVYETLVKPENPVIDYNTRFSGIKEGDLTHVTTTLRDVQAVLMNLCSDQTVLIGHSLESDFKMLKLIHKTVVDTSVVFPHRLGPPYKKALRTLSAEILKKIIQNSDSSSIDGHDSREDAVVCMELMLIKVKDDMKKLC